MTACSVLYTLLNNRLAFTTTDKGACNWRKIPLHKELCTAPTSALTLKYSFKVFLILERIRTMIKEDMECMQGCMYSTYRIQRSTFDW